MSAEKMSIDDCVERLDQAEARSEQLQDALASRDVIGVAKGIIMEREDVDSDAAFDILKSMSQRSNKKLREIAQSIVDSVDGANGVRA